MKLENHGQSMHFQYLFSQHTCICNLIPLPSMYINFMYKNFWIRYNTISPFITRYRNSQTDLLDETYSAEIQLQGA